MARSRISVTWKDEFRDATGYAVERSDGGEFREIARLDKGMNRFDDISLSPATTYTYRVCAFNASGRSGYSGTVRVTTTTLSGPIIIDHECTDLEAIPVYWIKGARGVLHIAYGHSLCGSQLTTGMEGLADFRGDLYGFEFGGGRGSALDLRDGPFAGAKDLTRPDRISWERSTRAYLSSHPEVNVVLWAWGWDARNKDEGIDLYLSLMEGLEKDYPGVMFAYMTAPLDGTGLKGSLHLMNDRIRDFCSSKGKILFDVEDIESYDPDGTFYADKNANNNCDYDSDMDGKLDANWAVSWQSAHMEGRDWFGCRCPRTKPLNANLKAYACWWMWARLAGWDGK